MAYQPDPDRDLVLERMLPLPPSSVWAAWTTPDLLMQWFTPAPWRTVACEIDLRPGGRFSTTMQSPEGETFPSLGSFVAVEFEQLLVFTSVMTEDFRPTAPTNNADDLPFTGRIELTPSGTDTAYRAIAIHPTPEIAAQHEAMGFHEGWGAALDQLVELMRT